MSVASKRLKGHRGAGVGSGRAPPGQRTSSAPCFVDKKLPVAPIFRDRTRMSELQRVPSLIGDIYESILDSSVWNGVFGDLVQFVGAQAGALLWKSHGRSTDVVHISGIKSPGLELYKERYAELDPATEPLLLREVGEVASTTELLSHSEYARSRFYKEWVKPQGFVDSWQASLEKSATSFVHLIFWRRSKTALESDATRDRMRFIVPHLRRAVLISNMVDHGKAEAALFGDTLDGIAAGLFLVDASGRILHANASGHALLARGVVLRAYGGKLVSNDAGAEQELYRVLDVVGGGEAAPGADTVAVPLTTRHGDHYVAHVLPLTSGVRRRAGTGYAAAAAVFVQKASLDVPSPQEAIAKLHKLTPMELRVLFAIVQVGGVPEVAAMMGSSSSTIRTHLRRLFSKTGTDRQADLVKLVAGYTNPLLPHARVFEQSHTIGGRGLAAPKVESSALDGRSRDAAWL
jgi:DNA-binding CsgD family transcriptional regulator